MIRRGAQLLSSATQLFGIEVIRQNSDIDNMMVATEKMLGMVGVTSHHDAITGTSVKAVSADYKKRVFKHT